MRFATFDRDFWELESGEERQRKYGGKFWLPSLERRTALQVGELAKLLFQIEGESEDGRIEIQVERMWVIVTEVLDQAYIGRLVNQPAALEPSDRTYLSLGAEIPFRSEHVIDVHTWSDEDVAEFFEKAPTKRWHGRA